MTLWVDGKVARLRAVSSRTWPGVPASTCALPGRSEPGTRRASRRSTGAGSYGASPAPPRRSRTAAPAAIIPSLPEPRTWWPGPAPPSWDSSVPSTLAGTGTRPAGSAADEPCGHEGRRGAHLVRLPARSARPGEELVDDRQGPTPLWEPARRSPSSRTVALVGGCVVRKHGRGGQRPAA